MSMHLSVKMMYDLTIPWGPGGLNQQRHSFLPWTELSLDPQLPYHPGAESSSSTQAIPTRSNWTNTLELLPLNCYAQIFQREYVWQCYVEYIMLI